MPKKIVEAKVIGQHVLNNSTKLIEVYAPELAELAVPGQFVNVQVFNCTAPLLRRPFGVAAVNKKDGTITMIYRIIGEATKLLAEYCSGDKLSIVGARFRYERAASAHCRRRSWPGTAFVPCFCFWQRQSGNCYGRALCR